MGWLAVFRSRRMAVLFLLGFSSGLPLLVTSQILQAWLTAEDIPLARIAAMNLVGLAYTFKFVWAPIALLAAIAAMSRLAPRSDLAAVVTMAIVVAVLSASQDIVVDAYMTDVLPRHERAAGSSLNITGYRIATVVSTSLAFVMADHIAWSTIWLVLSAMMVVGVVGTVLADEPAVVARPPRTIAESVRVPVGDLWRRYRGGTFLVLAFAAFYRFGDYFAQSLVMPFLLDGVGFSLTEIAVIYTLLGLGGTIVGGVFGTALVARFGLRRMLFGFGLMSATTHLLYIWLAVAGKSTAVFCVAVACDNAAIAMGAAALVAFLMSVCSPAVSATQFALFTSLASIGQRVFGPLAHGVVAAVGWSGYFAVCAAMALPGLVLVWLTTRVVERGGVAATGGAPGVR
ncbi:MAG: AmpG family muropeptide MFS transporter [Deltaproteobacteria bacterium]|nr:MAG: AmpG family muropeptide MFS transporter [Deltaproteobacteria bacterium]